MTQGLITVPPPTLTQRKRQRYGPLTSSGTPPRILGGPPLASSGTPPRVLGDPPLASTARCLTCFSPQKL